MAEAFATVTLPDGKQFAAPTADVLARWCSEGRVPADAVITEAGKPPVVASRHPTLAGLVPGGQPMVPPVLPRTGQAQPTDDAVSVIIPYRNGPALAGYYVSIASLIPGVGLIAGPVAVALGIAGLKKVKREPQAHGTAHAIVALVLGGLVSLASWGFMVMVIIAAIKK